MDTLAKRLTWAREKKEMTQAELAKAVGVSQSTIGNLEAGIRLTSRKVAQIAAVLEVDALWLSEGGSKPHGTQAEPPKLIINKQDAANDEVSADEIMELLAAYRSASPKDRKTVMSALRTAAMRAARQKKKSGHK